MQTETQKKKMPGIWWDFTKGKWQEQKKDNPCACKNVKGQTPAELEKCFRERLKYLENLKNI